MATENGSVAMGRLLRYIVGLWRREFHGEVTIPFQGARGLGPIRVNEGILPEQLPAVSLRDTDTKQVEEALRG